MRRVAPIITLVLGLLLAAPACLSPRGEIQQNAAPPPTSQKATGLFTAQSADPQTAQTGQTGSVNAALTFVGGTGVGMSLISLAWIITTFFSNGRDHGTARRNAELASWNQAVALAAVVAASLNRPDEFFRIIEHFISGEPSCSTYRENHRARHEDR